MWCPHSIYQLFLQINQHYLMYQTLSCRGTTWDCINNFHSAIHTYILLQTYVKKRRYLCEADYSDWLKWSTLLMSGVVHYHGCLVEFDMLWLHHRQAASQDCHKSIYGHCIYGLLHVNVLSILISYLRRYHNDIRMVLNTPKIHIWTFLILRNTHSIDIIILFELTS